MMRQDQTSAFLQLPDFPVRAAKVRSAAGRARRTPTLGGHLRSEFSERWWAMKHLPCLVCPHVLRDERPVRILVHHEDGAWQALCEGSDHIFASEGSGFAVVGLSHLFERQEDLAPLSTIAQGHMAEWQRGIWQVTKFDEDAEK